MDQTVNQAPEQMQYIVRRATEMFIEQGIKAVRMDDIAHELSISKRTLYEMFSDKRELMQACLNYHVSTTNCELMNSLAKAENVIEEIFLIIRAAYRENEHSRMFRQSINKYYPDLFEPFSRSQSKIASEHFRSMLRRGLEEGAFRSDTNVEFTEAMFVMMINGVVSSSQLMLPEGVTKQDAMSYVIVNFFRGFSTEQGQRMVDEYRRKYNDIKV